ncbi:MULTISPECIES: 5'-methylthioadenosine/S-adenosylhomocysteine nucleosidase [unclassified Solwaraspora]|uniref:5'-methylthioadenosine/S-adenosylhomocysteine nucleosidase family protein n=1 Tax=unclassified Solwaraspora TaxID=2627926 RepID=UPI00259BD97D|nr:5'-methylthioadenosine/S-adenosylhomocysteine nucleosidase [Solwaraspora sp. WMMA2056]WJK38731.1 5'-methylthioadenosine/S-adenosylhomocysteine nucleosidase [Solwaraspora sp. WMMA2056]
MIVVLVALEVERQEVRKRLRNLKTELHPAGTHFEVGTVGDAPGRSARIALALADRGNPAASLIAERAINHYKPAAVLFVGVAGGLRDWLALGDVVVATKVYGYHAGRSEETGFRSYPQAWPIPHEIDQAARHLANEGRWNTDQQHRARVHFEPIAAGEVVVNGQDVPEADLLHRHYADAVAVDMESAGVAHAGHVNRAVPTATIRGISDHASGKDRTDAEGWQPVAAAHAAMFALTLAARLDPGDRAADDPPVASTADGGDRRNVARTTGRNSPVVGQGGTIQGGVTFSYGAEES